MAGGGGDDDAAQDAGDARGGRAARWWPPALMAVVALAARALHWALAVPVYFPISDASHYHQIANNLAAGRGYSLAFPSGVVHATAFRPPLYPMLLGAAYRVISTDLAVGRALSVLLGVVAAVLTYVLATRLGGRRAGLVAGGLVAVYPPLVANDTMLLTEPLSLVVLLSALLALTARRWALAGVACGLLVLARPSAQYLVVVVGLWALWQLGWKRAAGLVAVAAVVVAPWVVRNASALGSPVLVTSNGFNWAAEYSPEAEAAGGFVDPVVDPAFAHYDLDVTDEVAWQDQLQRIAFTNLRAHPGLVVTTVGRNALAYLELTPSRNEPAELLDGRNLHLRRATLPLFYVVTVAGLVGLVRRARRPDVVLLLAVAGYFVATSLVLVPAPRLRAPFDLVCCIGVGLLVGAGFRWAPRRPR